jgi:hypothetical protein
MMLFYVSSVLVDADEELNRCSDEEVIDEIMKNMRHPTEFVE